MSDSTGRSLARSDPPITVEFVRDGVFHPVSDGLASPFTDEQDFHHLTIPGLGEMLQYFWFRADGSEQLILFGQPLELPTAAIAEAVLALAESFPDATPTFVLEGRTGWARATCGRPAEGFTHVVAAVVAATLYRASWDESDPIVVQLDGVAFDVSLSLEDERWKARVVTSSRAG